MSVSDKLKTDVAARNLVAIRDDLWSRIALDPNFTGGFPESWKYCLDNGITAAELYQEHDGRDIDLEPTGENFNLLAGQLRTNFSKERLDKIQKIGEKLYPPVNEEKSESQTSANVKGKTEPTGKEPSSDSGEAGLLLAGIAIGAVAGGIIGAAIFGKAVAAAVGAVIGAAAGGTIGATQSKK